MNIEEAKECFISAKKTDVKGKKHKGLLIIKPNQALAESYIAKAKRNLGYCEFYKNEEADYKLPEEWFYTMYYCAIAIISKFGIESRSQRCTAVFLRYAKDKKLIEYDDDFIERITVHPEKEIESDVDRREEARYGPYVKNKEVADKYPEMMDICRKAISQAEEIVHSSKKFEIPKEFL